MQDIKLVELAKCGDQDAFLTLLRRYDRQIMGVVYRFTGNFYDREDLYQEVFLHAFKALSGFRGESSFMTWLYRIALNRCLHYLKSKPVVAEAVEQAQDSPDYELQARLKSVHAAVERLQGPQRMCFHLHYIEGWPVEDIATTLTLHSGTVKSHLDRARKKIKCAKEVLAWQTN